MSTADRSETVKETALTAWHVAQGARMAEFANYQMPIQYSSIVAEHQATRTAAGVFDISHMGRLRFEGDRAAELLDHLLTRRVSDMVPGDVRYSMMCNEQGGILDDVLVSKLENNSGHMFFLLVVNAGNRAKILQWIAPHVADYPDVMFHDVSDATAMIAVQGPRVQEILGRLFPDKVLQLGYYKTTLCDQMQKPCVVSRTGYTGEDGFELTLKAEDAPRVWENVLLAGREHGILPVGLGARDTLRLEAGMPLYGHELSEEIDPYSAGLGFAVNLKDRDFLGREALERSKAASHASMRVGLKLVGRRSAREGASLLDGDGRKVGEVTSGTYSPTLQCPIAMGYLRNELAVPGTSVEVDIRGAKADAEVVPLPFYRRSK
ncbi:glycine cleavage system aminomethyltransferase GcvT [Aureliella helgolandensis]|uniref:Aminomethyltransferase n=1 Tax=Aureliella helgolandensis TaxID=2527968 RepID=A0A518GEZ7_9BACT|nr:glycine cleavage system aminomethyltransferase GcvT [Aureliella helgolandensis]QDV27176.1 Glycine cleavage system T protein [Aureliella helgolandensis]